LGSRRLNSPGRWMKLLGRIPPLWQLDWCLFWPALFFVGGDKGKEAQLAQLKGQRDTLMTASSAKGCNLNDLKPAVNKEMASAPPEAPAVTPALSVSEVEKKVDLLNELRTKGIITEDEYKTKRAQVIDAAMVPATTTTPTAPSTVQKPSPAVAPTSGLRAGDKLTYQEPSQGLASREARSRTPSTRFPKIGFR
jgi:hypothetical protein